jgi:hypothetical protein
MKGGGVMNQAEADKKKETEYLELMDYCAELKSDLAAAHARITSHEKVFKAVEKYLKHSGHTKQCHYVLYDSEGECDCGLREVQFTLQAVGIDVFKGAKGRARDERV